MRILRTILLSVTLPIALVAPAHAATTDLDVVQICSPLECASTDTALYPTVHASLGDPITITDLTVCTVACGFSTVFQNGTRLGVNLPRLRSVTITYQPSVMRPGYMIFSHSLDEACAGSGGRLTCHDSRQVYAING